jgi:transcriptional regulator with XRE-family HTH domain
MNFNLQGNAAMSIAPTIATNTVATIDHMPVAVAAEIPAAPAVDLPDFGGEEESSTAVGAMFVGLLPVAHRPRVPAANDDIAEDDNGEPSSDTGMTRDSHRGEANLKLRRILGPRLFRARELSGYSQTEAATALGYSTPAQLCQWEMSRRLAPVFEIIKAARLYGVSVDYLLGETYEPDRDPSAGARHAILRGVRGMLSKMAELTVGEIDRHARLIGPHASNVRGLIESGNAMLEALGVLVRHNHGAFVNMRGGASLQRLSTEFETALDEARVAIRLHDARDADLARVLASLGEANSLLVDDEA